MLPFIYREKSPNKHLRSYIKCYWRFRRKFGEGSKGHRVFPDSSYELIWVKQGPLLVDGKEAPQLFVGGGQNQPITISGKGVTEVWSVRLHPWGFVPFFSTLNLSSESTRAAELVFGEQIAAELTDVFRSSTKKTLADNLDEYFLDRMLHSRFEGAILKQAGRHILDTKGNLKVNDLADYCNVSRRKLERIINKSTGKGPHDIAARIRFEQLRNTLVLCPETPLASLAQEFGYVDQSHLHKEFRRYTGMTPSAYVKNFREIYAHIRHADVATVHFPEQYKMPAAQDRLFS